MPTVAVVLAGQARSPGAARRFVSDTLLTWGAAQYDENARLVVSELVTNAVLHARTEVVLTVELDADRLRLEVTDASVRQPVVRHYSLEATTGRGLALLDALAGRWGVDSHATGKTVWAELTPDGPHWRRRPEPVEVDLSSFPDLEPGTAEPSSPVLGPSAEHGPPQARRAA